MSEYVVRFEGPGTLYKDGEAVATFNGWPEGRKGRKMRRLAKAYGADVEHVVTIAFDSGLVIVPDDSLLVSPKVPVAEGLTKSREGRTLPT